VTALRHAAAARALTVSRGGRTVLDELSFTIARGQVTGLLGPSGCGKTTLMRRGRPGGVAVRAPGVTVPLARWTLTWATARRVLAQLRHDPRTIAMLIAVPALLRYVLNNPVALNRFAPEFIGVFPFIVMFVVAAVTTQRERARGTLERLMAMPLGKLDLLVGYAIAFGLVACFQVGLTLLITLTWLGVRLPGTILPLVLVAVLDALLGMSLGLFASAFARSEFQAVQFMPAFVLPQALLCGLLVARSQLTDVLRLLSDLLPLSYAVDAMQQIAVGASWSSQVTKDIAAIVGFTVFALAGGALTLRRQTR
jgi:ABC-2 type transport system permease protein